MKQKGGSPSPTKRPMTVLRRPARACAPAKKAAHAVPAAKKTKPSETSFNAKKLIALYPELFNAKATTAQTVGAFTSRAYNNITKKHWLAVDRAGYALATDKWNTAYRR